MGQPKAWLPFGPDVLLQRVVRQLTPVARPILVVAAPGQDLPRLPAPAELVRDRVEGQGPLQGLATGLEALPTGVDLVFVTATDHPFLAPGWVRYLAVRIGEADSAVPRVGGQAHPLAGLYRRSAALSVARRLLDSGERRLQALLAALQTIGVEDADLRGIDPSLRSLININTPDDYRQVLTMAGLDRS